MAGDILQPSQYNSLLDSNFFAAEISEKIDHHCGIFGRFLVNPLVSHGESTFRTMYALQSRGQEGAGVFSISPDGKVIKVKDAGLVTDVLTPENLALLDSQPTQIVLGQTRYSTSGGPNAWHPYGDDFVMVHNGNFTNPRDFLEQFPSDLQSQAESDSWIMHQAILQEYHRTDDLEGAMRTVLSKAEGAYSLIMAGEGKMYGVRDPKGVRPLTIGEYPDGSMMLASETTAIVAAGAKVVRDVEPGEGVVIDEDGLRTFFIDKRTDSKKLGRCIFELIYIGSPDSIIFGRSVSEVRRELGRQMARKDAEQGFLPDVIVPIQHSGIIATEGYSEEMIRILLTHPEKFGLTLEEALQHAPELQAKTGLIVNRYAGRSFIMPDGIRGQIADTKQRADATTLAGKKVVMIDDTIVRGESSKPIAKNVRKTAELLNLLQPAGLYLRAAAAPILDACYLGVDMPDRRKLIAARLHGDTDAIAKELGFDGVGYLTPKEMLAAVFGGENIDKLSNKEAFELAGFCGGCFIGAYPYVINPSRLFAKTNVAS